MTQENKEETLEIPTKKVDDAGADADEAGGDESEEKEKSNLTMMEFLQPDNKNAWIEKRWGFVTLYTLPFYLLSLFFAIYGVDQFTDVERRLKCPGKTADQSEAVYQLGIGLTVVYHSIEFMR